MIDRLGHYSLQNNPTIYDEEALTALELAGRTAAKLNEVVDGHNGLETNLNETLDAQNKQITHIQNVTVPREVRAEVSRVIESGEFDASIDQYIGDLETRVDTLLNSAPEGSTTMDMELLDIRVGADGYPNGNAGAAVRDQIEDTVQMISTTGVYTIPPRWQFSDAGLFHSRVFKVPEDGFSVRFPRCIVNINSVDTNLVARITLGTISGGEFVEDSALTGEYCSTTYTGRQFYIPHIPNVYARVRVIAMGDSKTQLTASNYTNYLPYLDLVKIYSGKVRCANRGVGFNNVTVRPATTSELVNPTWQNTNSVVKFMAFSSPVPLGAIRRVTVSPRYWLLAKVYCFDSSSRTYHFVETVAYNNNAPCFGCECSIDFSGYDHNHYAILMVGRVPNFKDYSASSYGSTTLTKNETFAGLSRDVESNIYFEWTGEMTKFSIPNTSMVVNENIELLKANKVSLPAAKHPYAQESWHYLGDIEQFSGILYIGGGHGGTFYYHVSPATYYAALHNPNSVAYGDTDATDGENYGISCSTFVSLIHGHPVPRSTFDFRYNDLPGFDRQPFNMKTEIHKLKAYDVLVKPDGNTGHCIAVTDLLTIGDRYNALRILESSYPATRESVFPLSSSLPYIAVNPADYYPATYPYACYADPAADETIADKADFKPPYTKPQKVMCSRGYGGIYPSGTLNVRVSIAPEVESITIYQDQRELGTYAVGSLGATMKNGYYVADITSMVGVGTIEIRNNLDSTSEIFHVIDTSGYEVNATVDGDTVTVWTNHNEDVKYIGINLRCITGEDNDTTAVSFIPEFASDGKMVIRARYETESEGTWAVSGNPDIMNAIRVIFKTDYDTNTFCKTAAGNIIC